LGAEVEVTYDDGSDQERAVALARQAEVVLLVLGYTAEDEGEFLAPEGLSDFARGFPTPTAEEQPIAEALSQAQFSNGNNERSIRAWWRSGSLDLASRR
jgi:beta-glucosidase